MQIDFAFILAAGKGTRMGEIGKQLPKPLWPIFDKSLLELQIRWCKKFNVKKIYINAHYLADQISQEVAAVAAKLKVEIEVLYEDPLLDSGGCIHNLASSLLPSYEGTVLLVNSDQFYFFDYRYMQEAYEILCSNNTPAVLFSLSVSKEDGYNETVLDHSKCLVSIEKNSIKEKYITYSGLGLINLKKLKSVSGPSKFFESVANFKEANVFMLNPEQSEYWDFGTSQLYAKNIFKIVSLKEAKTKTPFIDFLEQEDALIEAKINVFASQTAIDLERKSIFFPGKIHYKKIYQDI